MISEESFKIVVLEVFKSFNDEITLNMSPDNIEEWDSIGHLNLIMAVEKKYNIKIEFEEAIMIDNLLSLFNLINEKIS